jgi:hypothetical protein
MIKTFLLPLSMVFLFTGCFTAKNEIEKKLEVNNKALKKAFNENRVLPYDDVVNRGQYAEVWIAPYKDEDGNLFNERKMNFWVIEPDFIIGEELPRSKRLTIIKQKPLKSFDISPQDTKKFTIDDEVINYLNENGER